MGQANQKMSERINAHHKQLLTRRSPRLGDEDWSAEKDAGTRDRVVYQSRHRADQKCGQRNFAQGLFVLFEITRSGRDVDPIRQRERSLPMIGAQRTARPTGRRRHEACSPWRVRVVRITW